MLPLLLLLACAPDDPPAVDGPEQPLTEAPFTTLQGVWAPKVPPAATEAAIEDESFTVYELERYEEMGLGVQWEGPVDHIERAELAPDFVAEGADRRSLLYLWQAADPQLIDEESPIRFEAWAPIYRPNGHLTVHSFEAHVATARRISEISGRPFDFAVIAGDLTDGSQANELGWFLQAMEGGVLDPDSGFDDDPIRGPGNDYNDPLTAVGWPYPWYAAIGNHETTYNGGFDLITPELRQGAGRDRAYDAGLFPNGWRDGETEHAALRTDGWLPPDQARFPLYREEVLDALEQARGLPRGHGLTPADVEAGRAWFSVHPVPGKPLRLIVLDTVHTDGGVGVGSMGWISEDQLAWLQAELADADANHELVLVMSHHRLKDLAVNSPASEEDVAAALAASDGVFLLVTGHGHSNTEHLLRGDGDPADPTDGFWQLMLASTIDFPMHSRVIEVVDEGDGHLSIYTTNLDHNSPTGSMAHLARAQAAGKWAWGDLNDEPDVAGNWAGQVDSMNLLLRIEIPDAVAEELARHDWPERIETLETLAALPAPESAP